MVRTAASAPAADAPPGKPMSVVITLVHGTFGRLFGKDAAWTREESILRQRLGAELRSDVVFLPFRWSGMNWPAARYAAARRLREHFRATAAQYAERRHYVVAHSHGGNVALYALRDAERERQPVPDGVVCLSTPFIAAQPRSVTLFRFVATYAVILVTLFAVTANVMGRLLVPWIATAAPENSVLRVLLLNEIWLEFLLCAVLAWNATNGLVTLARARREQIAVERIGVPVRIYRSIGDEATALLATSSFFSWLCTLAWGIASAVTIGVAGIFGVLVFWPAMLLIAGALILEPSFGGSRLRRSLARAARSRRVWAAGVTIGTMAAFGAWGFFLAGTPLGTAETTYATSIAVLVLAVITFSTVSGLGYGLTAPFLEVTAEATPVGSWEIHLFAARTWSADAPLNVARTASLSHSAAYADEGVLGAIAGWIDRHQAKGGE